MLTSMTGHDCVLLRADDPLIDMNYITSFTGMTDKWFYRLISEGYFPKPIKLGRSSRWYKSEVEQWMQQRIMEGRSMKRVVIPVRWQCARCQRWYCGVGPCPWCWPPRESSCVPSGQPAVCHPD